MVNFYALMVQRGLKDIEDVPEKYKQQVKDKLGIVDEEPEDDFLL